MLEGGSHVPFIAHWPKGLTGGKAYAPPVSGLDIAATVVALGRGIPPAQDLRVST